jgi:hypothetical protein
MSWAMIDDATLRDMFAAHALSGLMAAPDYDGSPRDAAKLSYQLADAMMVARKRRADARLIAAAPELLEALQRLDRRGYLSEHPCASDDGNADFAFCRAVIAKATRETP